MDCKQTIFISYINSLKLATFGKQNSGLSLLEVLISILLLSISVLGVTRLYWAVINSNQSAILDNLGVLRAQSLVERLFIDSKDPHGEVLRWQTINKKILPDSKYKIANYPIKAFELSWFDTLRHKRQTIIIKL